MADKLPPGFIDDDDKLRRNDSWRREKKTGRRAYPRTGASVCIGESRHASPGARGPREPRSVWTDSGKPFRVLKIPGSWRKLKNSSFQHLLFSKPWAIFTIQLVLGHYSSWPFLECCNFWSLLWHGYGSCSTGNQAMTVCHGTPSPLQTLSSSAMLAGSPGWLPKILLLFPQMYARWFTFCHSHLSDLPSLPSLPRQNLGFSFYFNSRIGLYHICGLVNTFKSLL